LSLRSKPPEILLDCQLQPAPAAARLAAWLGSPLTPLQSNETLSVIVKDAKQAALGFAVDKLSERGDCKMKP